MAASYAVARGGRLPGFAAALDPSRWRSQGLVEVILAALFAATVRTGTVTENADVALLISTCCFWSRPFSW